MLFLASRAKWLPPEEKRATVLFCNLLLPADSSKNRGGVDWNVSDFVTEMDNTGVQGAKQTRVLQGLV